MCGSGSLICSYACLNAHAPIQQPPESTSHLFPFMLPVAEESDLKQLYTKVRNTMQGIHKEKLPVRELEKIARDW